MPGWADKALAVLAILLALGGVGLFSYPFFTDIYSEKVIQQGLAERFLGEEAKKAYTQGDLRQGQPLTRIIIPRIGVDTIVVEGTSPSALRAGAGHYEGTPLPCQPGNVAIAGHRTTYGRPFNRLDELGPGDLVILETPFERCEYEVAPAFDGHPNPWVTTPYDWSVVAPTDYPALTLTTCHPKGSARQRLILRARLVRTAPRSGA